MSTALSLGGEGDWDTLTRFLPNGWEEKAKELGALRRCRRFNGAGVLLRTLMIHLSDGCSLRETSVRAKQGNLASVSDVALLKRLKAAGEWLRWMADETRATWVDKQPLAILGAEFKVRIIDGSTIQEPGSTGSTWRIHYSIDLPSLRCSEVHVTGLKVGESFKQFKVQRGDLFLGDRGFAHRVGVSHVVENGGHVLVRINLTNLPLVDAEGNPFPLLAHLRSLAPGEIGDWDVWVPHKGSLIPGRVCAVRKSGSAAEKARRKALADNRRKGHVVKAETVEAAAYIFVFTTLGRQYSPSTVLEVYRGRWQVELAFKRLKSIIGLGHLKKTDPEAAKAWLHGKLLVAFLVEALIAAGERFFPWGYPLCPAYQVDTVPLEGNIANASPAD